MDNIAFHKTEKVAALLRSKNLEALYIPPYSPQFNPIEEVFSRLKHDFRKLFVQNDEFAYSAYLALSRMSAYKDLAVRYNHTRRQ